VEKEDGNAGEVEVSAEHIAVTADGRNSNGAQVTNITFQCKQCKTFMGNDVIKCFVCGAVGDSLVPVHKEGFKPNEKEMTGVKQMTTFDDKKVQWTADALQKLEGYPEGHVRRRAQARVEKNARVQSIETVSVAFLDRVLNEKITNKSEENKALDEYMNDELKVTDFIWTEKANSRLELVPKGFMRDNTRNRVMTYALSINAKEITLEVCEAGIRESVKMMEEAIANGATLEDFLPKKEGVSSS
ncbi:MAG: PCP reductase family protein, partial [Nitrospinota bacterium]|nr:PCP reductase family protein [Nitrospinota bacterium]